MQLIKCMQTEDLIGLLIKRMTDVFTKPRLYISTCVTNIPKILLNRKNADINNASNINNKT